MSGSSEVTECPRCGGSMLIYSDWKPHDSVFGECLECGFSYNTIRIKLTLEEVNERRLDEGSKPIESLKQPTNDWIKWEGGWENEKDNMG